MAIADETPVKVIEMGHLVEIRMTAHTNHAVYIKRVDKDHYMQLETGEIKEYEHIEARNGSYDSLRKTFKNIRYLINNNFDGSSNELFCTFTYAENMTDRERLYKDLDKLIKRLRYEYKEKTTIDYLTVIEPQERGAWHAHILVRFNDLDRVYLANSELSKMWGHGFVTVRTLRNVDNIGAYVSAYLSDVELDEGKDAEARPGAMVVEVKNDGKKFIKGGRLHMYPPGMNIYRASRGIKKPDIKVMKYREAKEKTGSAQPVFEKKYVFDNGDFHNETVVEQYNLKRL